MESKVVWKDEMAFDVQLEGFTFTIDADPSTGGHGLGPKPKGLLLSALAGCTAMDVIAILRRMHVEVDHFEVAAEGRLAETHPKRFLDLHLSYRFEGKDLPLGKLERAIQLSEERYCAVSAMLRESAPITRETVVNGVRVEAPAAEPGLAATGT